MRKPKLALQSAGNSRTAEIRLKKGKIHILKMLGTVGNPKLA